MNKFTIYGLPLTPRALIGQLAGASFCVSYATRKDLGKQLDDAIRLVGKDQILLVDNGAFTLHKKGVSTMDESYLDGFAAWANDITARCPQAIVVLPDIIGGSHEQNANLAIEATMMLNAGERLMPIWHLHEPISYLLYLCEGFDYVGFGSSGDYWQVGTPKWHARIAEAFAAIGKWEAESEGAYIRPRIHMMRAQSMAHLYQFDSSDSSNVAVNHCRYKAEGEGHVGRFAKRVNTKIQASAGPASPHQVVRPLDEMRTDFEICAQAMAWAQAHPERMAEIAAQFDADGNPLPGNEFGLAPIAANDDGIPEFLRRDADNRLAA